MRQQAQHCPVARAADLLGEPGTLLIVRELTLGSQRLTELARGVPGMSSSRLATRLRTLLAAGLVERLPGDQRGTRYRLTAAGQELRPLVDHLGRWGQRWTPAPLLGDLDPDLLLFDISRQLDRERLPVRPVSVQIELSDGPPPRRWWLTLSRAGTAARDDDPGIPVSLRLDCTLTALAGVWLGYTSWLDAVRTGSIRLTGDPGAVRAIGGWLGASRYATTPHPASRPGLNGRSRRSSEENHGQG